MRRTLTRTVAGAGLLGLALAGCVPASMIDRVPGAVGGLPAGAPQRPENPYQFPAVHDMPPARAAKPLNEEDQVRLEQDLAAVRDRQAGEVAKGDKGDPDEAAPAAKPATKPAAKKKPADAKTGQNAGANTGAKPNP
jgi:hypothetical protein